MCIYGTAKSEIEVLFSFLLTLQHGPAAPPKLADSLVSFYNFVPSASPDYLRYV